MDEAARNHHMWADPKLKKLPSEYFREHGAASFQDDPIGLELAERHQLVEGDSGVSLRRIGYRAAGASIASAILCSSRSPAAMICPPSYGEPPNQLVTMPPAASMIGMSGWIS